MNGKENPPASKSDAIMHVKSRGKKRLGNCPADQEASLGVCKSKYVSTQFLMSDYLLTRMIENVSSHRYVAQCTWDLASLQSL